MSVPMNEVDAATLKSWMDRGEAVLVDVREENEFARESIPGSTLVPLSKFDPAKVPAANGKKLVVSCVSGKRSANAQGQLAKAGVDAINFTGGITAWKAANYPIRENKSAPLPMMRQVQIAAGSLVLTGAVLGTFAHPGFYALSAAVGAGLIFAGITGWCGMTSVLGLLPYNRASRG